jgi:hypothetical protein
MKYWDGILVPIVLPFLQQRNFDHVFQHAWQCKMSRGSCLARLYEPESKSWTDRTCHAVWRFAEFSNVCNHLLQQCHDYCNTSPTHNVRQRHAGCCSTRA